jgi:hypothetical protein
LLLGKNLSVSVEFEICCKSIQYATSFVKQVPHQQYCGVCDLWHYIVELVFSKLLRNTGGFWCPITYRVKFSNSATKMNIDVEYCIQWTPKISPNIVLLVNRVQATRSNQINFCSIKWLYTRHYIEWSVALESEVDIKSHMTNKRSLCTKINIKLYINKFFDLTWLPGFQGKLLVCRQ